MTTTAASPGLDENLSLGVRLPDDTPLDRKIRAAWFGAKATGEIPNYAAVRGMFQRMFDEPLSSTNLRKWIEREGAARDARKNQPAA